MDTNTREICLALVSYDNECVSFLNKKSYVDFLKNHGEQLGADCDVLVILRGGDGIIVSPKIAAHMSWIMDE